MGAAVPLWNVVGEAQHGFVIAGHSIASGLNRDAVFLRVIQIGLSMQRCGCGQIFDIGCKPPS